MVNNSKYSICFVAAATSAVANAAANAIVSYMTAPYARPGILVLSGPVLELAFVNHPATMQLLLLRTGCA